MGIGGVFVGGAPRDLKRVGRPAWREYRTFLASALKDFHRVGALAPSSPALAHLMARAAGRSTRLVELGAGTGRITRALLDHLPADGQLLALETDAAMRTRLSEELQDARLNLRGENAEDLVQVLGSHQVGCVVSGLPFQILEPRARHRILAAVRTSLLPGGRLVAFQYGRRALPLFKAHFRTVRVLGPVWRNLPPALVFICQP